MSDQISIARVPPASKNELMTRAQNIAGQTLGQLAQQVNWPVPDDLKRHKGWVGQLLELLLGADAGSQAEPDFISLGIELKTLPLNANGSPKESTYVCTAPLSEYYASWQECWLRRKLAQVLWVPVEADNSIPLAARYVGQAFLWQPDAEQLVLLERDWQELMETLLQEGQAALTARQGEVLQIRPKAANNKTTTKGVGEDGELTLINPRGFYLRSQFTAQILAQSQTC